MKWWDNFVNWRFVFSFFLYTIITYFFISKCDNSRIKQPESIWVMISIEADFGIYKVERNIHTRITNDNYPINYIHTLNWSCKNVSIKASEINHRHHKQLNSYQKETPQKKQRVIKKNHHFLSKTNQTDNLSFIKLNNTVCMNVGAVIFHQHGTSMRERQFVCVSLSPAVILWWRPSTPLDSVDILR